eukprot:Seg1444.4 transcript_id=Seg1444.4/GoldUCD/mRNA.D3Y31 product="hypothetical protein" protein_id=Seg1444.4/GoldUCD/D3Y31
MIPQRQKGVYKIQCKSGGDFKKLKNFKLAIKDGKEERARSIGLELPRNHKPKGQEFHNGTVLTIIGSCENGLEQEENEHFDTFFSDYGTIVQNTWFQTYKGNNQNNGKRCIVIQLKQGTVVSRDIDYSNDKTNATGRIRVFYKGQPYDCIRCQAIHDGQCPKRMAEREIEEEDKLDREIKTKTLIISDSTLRKAAAMKTNADIVCISGGKIGHLVNSLSYNEKMLKYDNYVFVGGLNNIDRGESKETERAQTYKQLLEVGKAVKDIVDADEKKTFYLVPPINAPSKDPIKIKDTTELMKNMEINNRKQGKIEVIETNISSSDKKIFDDDLHLNQIGTTRLMKSIDDAIGNLLRKEKVTTNRMYSKVETEYPWGCNACCKEGHEEEDCDVLPKKRDASHLSSPENGNTKKKDKKR